MIDELICLLRGKFLIQDGGLRIVMQTLLRLDFTQVSNVSHWPPVVCNILGQVGGHATNGNVGRCGC